MKYFRTIFSIVFHENNVNSIFLKIVTKKILFKISNNNDNYMESEDSLI